MAAQYLIKISASSLSALTLNSLMTNMPLWFGLALYGVSTGLLILALRDGELSLLYPVISLTYVWVTIMSVVAFHEKLTFYKIAGISVICLGVTLLGKGRTEE